MLEDTTRANLLYDFYGNLLTAKQREVFELYFQHDLSLGEIAEGSGISRQGVHDLARRAVRTLKRAEARLGLVARFAWQEKVLQSVRQLLSEEVLRPEARAEALSLLEELLD
ncbi:MAG: YlxM family DNA-binding protein [Dethiobacter sp.]|nr:YlxM family DNA-binding protein [Dethiobacter sp.]MCL5981745.1 YlxM family DNA-binding protein [Bacillota bacterium]